MPADDDIDRSIAVESEKYNWTANGGTPPQDGEYVAEFERFVETDPDDPPGVALHFFEGEDTDTELVGVGIVVTEDVPELTPDGRENEVVFRADFRNGRVAGLTHDAELEAERDEDLYEILGLENPQSTDQPGSREKSEFLDSIATDIEEDEEGNDHHPGRDATDTAGRGGRGG